MKYKINSYLAALIITIIGAGASMIIVHVAYDNAYGTTVARAISFY